MIFKEYWKEQDKTKEAFEGEWSSAGDMAKRDEDGFYTLMDRKANMIITGGENGNIQMRLKERLEHTLL